jgi:hypothetical protein
MATATADATTSINYTNGRRSTEGRPLAAENQALIITTTSGGAATINYDIKYTVRGIQQ